MNVPRSEYPRPQCVRDQWLCLNGPWQFEIDGGDSGLERGLLERELAREITVPFCPESKLSGVEHTDFMLAVWYRRQVRVPQAWRGRRVLLHFQAVDHDATVWADGREVGRHRGGQTPFTCDLGDVGGREVTIVVRARDDWRGPQARGKQSQRYENHGCLYTRTTGIWQTVWMEPVPAVSLCRPRLTPDVGKGVIRLEQRITAGGPGPHAAGLRVRARLRDGQMVVAEDEVAVIDFSPRLDLAIPAERRRLWAPGEPHLYDVEIELVDERDMVLDRVASYAALRSVSLRDKMVLINGQPVFQRLVLDQGYYPDGLLTAPSDEALARDIELALEAGFNGARLHQKVFEERFLYHADRLGYLCWGEFADWGCNVAGPEGDNQRPGASYITQWLEVLERDHSHPSIVGWCALNETGQALTDRVTQLDDVTRGMFLAAKAMDGTRPVLDASGYSHRVTESDVYDSHDYDQDPASFANRHAGLRQGRPFVNRRGERQMSIAYRGQPYFVSEFGGIWWNPAAREDEDSWGYGDRPGNIEAFYERFDGLCRALLEDANMFGYCYTQLTDVFQEQNGIYGFGREVKFDLARLRAVQQRVAAIERAAGREATG